MLRPPIPQLVRCLLLLVALRRYLLGCRNRRPHSRLLPDHLDLRPSGLWAAVGLPPCTRALLPVHLRVAAEILRFLLATLQLRGPRCSGHRRRSIDAPPDADRTRLKSGEAGFQSPDQPVASLERSPNLTRCELSFPDENRQARRACSAERPRALRCLAIALQGRVGDRPNTNLLATAAPNGRAFSGEQSEDGGESAPNAMLRRLAAKPHSPSTPSGTPCSED